MASLKCSNCGFGIHNHGEPNDTEYIMIKQTDWEEITKKSFDSKNKKYDEFGYPFLYRSDTIERENPSKFIELWKCSQCNAFMELDEDGAVQNVWTVAEEEPDERGDIYFVFNDILWRSITEASIPVMKINDEYKPLYYGMRTEDSLVLFEDEKLEHIIKYYKREKC